MTRVCESLQADGTRYDDTLLSRINDVLDQWQAAAIVNEPIAHEIDTMEDLVRHGLPKLRWELAMLAVLQDDLRSYLEELRNSPRDSVRDNERDDAERVTVAIDSVSQLLKQTAEVIARKKQTEAEKGPEAEDGAEER